MKTLMFTGAATAAILLAAPAAQAGMVSTCTHADQTRIIEVVYTGEGVLPCEVHYSKDAGTQTLWSATNAAGYCEEKAPSDESSLSTDNVSRRKNNENIDVHRRGNRRNFIGCPCSSGRHGQHLYPRGSDPHY